MFTLLIITGLFLIYKGVTLAIDSLDPTLGRFRTRLAYLNRMTVLGLFFLSGGLCTLLFTA